MINDKKQLKQVTLNDLERWAGRTIVSRGKDYQAQGSVTDLVYDPIRESLRAQVNGSMNYTTQVSLSSKGTLHSQCTCPYYDTCKHAVAVVLEYLAQINQGDTIASTGTISTYLRQQTKEQLITLLEQLTLNYPSVAKILRQRATPAPKRTAKQELALLEKEITRLIREGEHYDNIDPGSLEQRLREFLTLGYADELISVGQDVFKLALLWMEHSGETDISIEITECVSVVFSALPHCSLSTIEKMHWVLDLELQDEYDLCVGSLSFWETPFSTSDWSQMADALLKRVRTMLSKKIANNFSTEYHADQLIRYLVKALKRAERENEIIPLFLKELVGKTSKSYITFVDLLQQAKRTEEASQWIHKGIVATLETAPGIAKQLRDRLQVILDTQQRWDQATAIAAEDFFDAPSLENFNTLQQWAQKNGTLSEVKTAALHYLETGQLPYGTTAWTLPPPTITLSRKSKNNSSNVNYRAPYTNIAKFPQLALLIRLAISEQRFDDAVHWFNKIDAKTDKWTYESLAEYVAKAVIATHPEVAITILKNEVKRWIDKASVSTYQEAIDCLTLIRSALLNLGPEEEWLTYLQQLRDGNIRKYRLIELIDTLEPKVKKTVPSVPKSTSSRKK